MPLTLTEAVAKGRVQVLETGQVNELKIENTGDEEVFIQAGDMVKGGRQDRVLMVSLVLPPRSGMVPISSFCVEPGRWSARGAEDATKFSSARDAMPSRKTLAIMAAPSVSGPGVARPAGEQMVQGGSDTSNRQRRVWDEVAKMQADLSSGINASVAAPQSASSLQLALEHEKLNEARQAYVAGLEPFGLKDSDIIGYVAAINGQPRERQHLSIQRAVSEDVEKAAHCRCNGGHRRTFPLRGSSASTGQRRARIPEHGGERCGSGAGNDPALTAGDARR